MDQADKVMASFIQELLRRAVQDARSGCEPPVQIGPADEVPAPHVGG